MKNSITLNLSRSLEINSLLLNGTIANLYFPAYGISMKEKSYLKQQQLMEKERHQERIYGLLILTSLKYDNRNKLSIEKTDMMIELFKDEIDIINDVFMLNIGPENWKIEQFDNFIFNFNKNRRIRKSYIPDLFFDPCFEAVYKNEAIKKITSRNPIKEDKYISDLISQADIELFKKPHNINPSLKISLPASVYPKILGTHFFGSSKSIDDLIELFNDYFVVRIPSREDEIYQTLLCFGVLMKMLKGKGYFVSSKTLLDELIVEVGSDFGQNFLDNYFITTSYGISFNDFESFDFKSLMKDYHSFLKYAGYLHYGKIYTGVFLVWRALMKYLEELQKEKEFKKIKGALLENWAYKIAEENGFCPEKIILRNINKPPTPRYYKMKKQISDFPKKALEFKVPFFKNKSSYFEIDVAFKVKEVLFIIECKSTMIPFSSEWNIFKWNYFMNDDMKVLQNKTDLLQECLEKKLIKHHYILNVKKVIPLILKTEGIVSNQSIFSPEIYKDWLVKMREAIVSGDIDNFLKERMVD